jgi:calcium-dependent protein kinase
LYILLCGYPPFNGVDNRTIYKAIREQKLIYRHEDWAKISSEAKDLVTGLLQKNPDERISIEDALLHPWMKTNRKAKVKPTKHTKMSLGNLKNFNVDSKLK